MTLTRTQKIDLLVVGAVLGVILIANLMIYFRFKNVINTNYYFLPDETTPAFENQFYVFLALEKNFTSEETLVQIRDTEENSYVLAHIEYYEVRGDKYIFYANFTFWDEYSTSEKYVFFYTYRSWYSEPFQCIEPGYFQWVE
jgi:hypothetical protein